MLAATTALGADDATRSTTPVANPAAAQPKSNAPIKAPALASVSKITSAVFPKSAPAPLARPESKPAPKAEPTLYESSAPVNAECEIDKLVMAKLGPLGVKPVLCSDAVFVRRAFLDVIGTLPTAEEARAFLVDTKPGKRRVLIDQLLRRDEFAVYWAMKWSDLLRIKAEFLQHLWPDKLRVDHRP